MVEIKEKVEVLTEKNIREKTVDEPDNSEYLNIKVLEDLPTFTGMDAKNYTLKMETQSQSQNTMQEC